MTEATKPIKLSKRQKQLFPMLDQGLSNRDIAEKLDISEHTVKVHFWRLFTRIGVNSRGQALKWWRTNRPSSDIDALVVGVGAFLAASQSGGSAHLELAALQVAYARYKGEVKCVSTQ
jgi:DNA-binding CsgD family transcriptional regulator